VCVIAASAQAVAPVSEGTPPQPFIRVPAGESPSEPAWAHSWYAITYLWLAAGTIAAFGVLHALGRRPLALGPPRVHWPLAPAPSLFLIAVLMMAGAVAASGAAQLSGASEPDSLRDGAIASLANYGTQLLLMAGIWWALSETLMRRAIDPQSDAGQSTMMIGLRAAQPDGAAAPVRRVRAVAVGALAMAIAWPVVQAAGVIASTIQQWLSGTSAPETAHRTLEAMGQSGDPLWIALMGLVAVLMAPLVEEILYRGALQQALKGIGMPRAVALLGASALFALAHWGSLVAGGEAGALTMLMILGLVFGWTYERTGSMWAPFAAHATFNAANLAIFLVQR
jgi:membrane protease YdiL (CAAX protease family)